MLDFLTWLWNVSSMPNPKVIIVSSIMDLKLNVYGVNIDRVLRRRMPRMGVFKVNTEAAGSSRG